jgi:hypothetical protein
VDLASSTELAPDGYGAEVRRQVSETVVNPVVVGHSGTGLLVPAAARALGARPQGWLAAIIPDGQRSMLDEVSAAPSEIFTAVKVTTGGSAPPCPDSNNISPPRPQALPGKG